MKVEVGCGLLPIPWVDVHHDRIKHSEHVDLAWDLNELPWPWEDSSINTLIGIDVFEHLEGDPWWFWLDEAWRVVEPGGVLIFRVPVWSNPLSWRDPTHHRVFHEDTFHYWDPCRAEWQDYGRMYPFADAARWWHVVGRSPDPTDYRYVLRKLLSVEDDDRELASRPEPYTTQEATP